MYLIFLGISIIFCTCKYLFCQCLNLDLVAAILRVNN